MVEVKRQELSNPERRLFRLRLPDGRILAGAEFGDPKGKPVLLLHGTPGSREGPVLPRSELEGIRLITLDRPGYGESSRNKGRSVADFVHDMKYFLDEFGINKCAIMGRSGGGISALGFAALYPDRVTKVVVSGVFSPQRPSEGMIESNIRLFTGGYKEGGIILTYDQIEEIYKYVVVNSDLARKQTYHLENFPPGLRDEERKDIQQVPGLEQDLIASYKNAIRNGPGGWVDDIVASREPWGFDLGSITTPVIVHQALNDQYVSPKNGPQLVAAIPGATYDSSEGSHFSFYNKVPTFLRWLIEPVNTG